MEQPSIWVGIAGVLAFALIPYVAVLVASGRIKQQVASGSRAPPILIFVLVLAAAYRIWLWTLVPAEEKTLGYWNWPLLGGVMTILAAAELQATGIIDAMKQMRGKT